MRASEGAQAIEGWGYRSCFRVLRRWEEQDNEDPRLFTLILLSFADVRHARTRNSHILNTSSARSAYSAFISWTARTFSGQPRRNVIGYRTIRVR